MINSKHFTLFILLTKFCWGTIISKQSRKIQFVLVSLNSLKRMLDFQGDFKCVYHENFSHIQLPIGLLRKYMFFFFSTQKIVNFFYKPQFIFPLISHFSELFLMSSVELKELHQLSMKLKQINEYIEFMKHINTSKGIT